MSLQNGQYLIFSAIDGGDRQVNRSPVEDLSLRPKNIWTLHVGMQNRPWIIEKAGSGEYFLKAIGAPVGTGRHDPDHVYAFLLREMASSLEWKLERTENKGREAYRICTKDGRAYWTTSREERTFGYLIDLKPREDTDEQVFYIHYLVENARASEYGYEKNTNNDNDDSQSTFSYGRREKKFCA